MIITLYLRRSQNQKCSNLSTRRTINFALTRLRTLSLLTAAFINKIDAPSDLSGGALGLKDQTRGTQLGEGEKGKEIVPLARAERIKGLSQQ
jgi:hypothetical protein